MKTPLSLAAAIIAAAALAGCASSSSTSSTSATSSAATASATSEAPTAAAAAFPVTVKAANGAVTIKAEPTRIVSLSPTSTEDLYAVGAGKQVVAVDADSNYPAGIPKTSLSGLTPNIEAIARYNPSLVVTYQNVGGLVPGARQTRHSRPDRARGRHARRRLRADRADRRGDRPRRPGAERCSGHEAADRRRHQAGRRGPQGPHLLLGAERQPLLLGDLDTFIGQIAGLFGLKNVADAADKASDGGYPELSEEYIVTARPQLIFLADNGPTDGGQTPAVVARPTGWSVLPAVKNHEVIPLNDDVASRWGPRLPQLVEQIAQAVERAPSA